MKRGFILLLALAAVACQPKYSWKEDLQGRIAVDFDKTREEVKEYIQKYIPDVTDSQIDEWTKTGDLESMDINGQTLYFHNAAPNLFRVNAECKAIKDSVTGVPPAGTATTAQEIDIVKNMDEIIPSGEVICAPKRMHVKYTLTVNADAVPEGKTIRCWLPYPRVDVARQKDVKFISAGAKSDGLNYFTTQDPESKLLTFSAPECAHSTLYMEQKAVKGMPTVFTEEFEYTSCGEFHGDLENQVQPYDTTTALYKEYTAEREAHMIFTPRIKAVADSLTEGIENPYLIARALFKWVDNNFPWASAREYSTIENIPMYVLGCGHGDCGQVTLLFTTMCRYKGIPAHFQSGFMMHPGAWNLHDWAEIYFEGVGWVPADESFGIPTYIGLDPDPQRYWFYLGGIDSWRMVVNNDFGKALDPAKKYPRSETVDFQRGEVEWEGGNLYFPCWDWDMDIDYLNK